MRRYMIPALVILLAVSCGRSKYAYDASGTFEAREVIVSSEVAGRILWLETAEGSRLEAGAPVGLVDTTQLHLRRLQLLASRDAVGSRRLDISAQIAATAEQIATQRRERDRVERLLAANAANTKQLDDVDSSIAVLEKQLSAQRAQLESSNRSLSGEASGVELQVAQIEDQIERSILRSPLTGTVLVKYAEAGEVTGAGMPLFKVADTDELTLRAYVTSGQLTRLRLGQEVKVYTDFGDSGSREYSGRVTWISDSAEFTPKTIQTRDERANLVYAVKIAVRNDGYIKIGMYGDVKFN